VEDEEVEEVDGVLILVEGRSLMGYVMLGRPFRHRSAFPANVTTRRKTLDTTAFMPATTVVTFFWDILITIRYLTSYHYPIRL
jgi:hypothetical protein